MTTFPDGTKVYTPFPDYEVTDPPTGNDTIRTTYRIAGQIVAVQTKVIGGTSTLYFAYTDHLGNITPFPDYEEEVPKSGTPVTRRVTFSANGQAVVLRRKVGAAAAELFSLHTNHLGSVSAVGDSSGAYVADSYAVYEPFGAFVLQPTGTNPGVSDRGFTGHRHNNTGANNLELIYMNARYYLPEVGRFISPDSIVPDPSNPQSYNRYTYTNNNPMGYTDPTGHWLESALDLAFIAYDIYDIQQNGLNWTNGLSLAVDIGGLALPVVTGGGLMVRAISHGDDVAKVAAHVDDFGPVKAAIEALKAGDTAPMEALQHWQKSIVRRFVSEGKMLEKLGYAGSAKKSISALVDGKMVTTIPDYFDEGAKIIGEIKDVAELQGTTQIKAQLAWALNNSYQYRIHVRPDTKIPKWLFDFWEDNKTWFEIVYDVTGLE